MINKNFLTEFNAPIRNITSIVRLLHSGNLTTTTFSYNSNLKSVVIDRQGESGKFFGFGVAQKATLKLIDKNRSIKIKPNDLCKVFFNIEDSDYVSSFPTFEKPEVKRDENTNEITVVFYDKLYAAAAHKMAEIELQSYTILELVEAIATTMSLELDISRITDTTAFDTLYIDGANIEGTESFRDILDDVAEVTQSIYYISGSKLVFKRLDSKAAADLKIEKQHYFTLKSEEVKTLGAIASITELGDNVSTTAAPGVTQYVRNNVFWELRKDIDVALNTAIATIGGTSITPFNLMWRGNFLIEPGDKIEITAKDNSTFSSFILSDTITYNGGYSHKTEWKYEEPKAAASNPTTLGEALKETFAKVDKQNKTIELVASETSNNKSAITALQLDVSSINASVSGIESKVDTNSGTVEELKKSVEATMTKEQIDIAIKNEIANGTSKVETTTGFTFNEDGLTVSKSGSEISTQITEDGMKVKKNNTDVLTANNEGVKAIDLHAETYLIIGNNSRFEDYGSGRTGCFWIGG